MKYFNFLIGTCLFLGGSLTYACNRDKTANHNAKQPMQIADTGSSLDASAKNIDYRYYWNRDSLRTALELGAINGSEADYKRLISEYKAHRLVHNLLYTSLVRANKYNDKRAYFKVFFCLATKDMSDTEGYKQSLSDLPLKMKNIALHYLLKAKELGDESALYVLENELIEYKNMKSTDFE